MSLERVIQAAYMSRVAGGVMMNEAMVPLPNNELQALRAKVRDKQIKTIIYHLDEEGCKLNKYVHLRAGYVLDRSFLLSPKELHDLQMQYIVASGETPEKHRFRQPWLDEAF